METSEQKTTANEGAENYLRRISNRIKDGFSRFYRFFWPTSVQGQDKPAAEPSKPEPLDAINKTLEDEFSHYEGNVEINGVEKDFMLSAKFMVSAGYTDGVHGLCFKPRSEDVTMLAMSRATRLHNLAHSVIKSRLIKATTELDEKKELLERYKTSDKREHQQLEMIQYYRGFHPRSFDKMWSVLSIAFGFILIAADFPLSIKLIAYGFNLAEGWELYSTAAGICLCTVFIKIYYDHYIDLKFGNTLIFKNRFKAMLNSIFVSAGNSVSEADHAGVEQEATLKKRWYSVILGFTLAGIIVLGVFRMYAAQIDPDNKDMFKSMPEVVYLITFIFLTLVFPLIGGICFSTGLSGFLNRKLFNESLTGCKDSTALYIETLKSFSELQEISQELSGELARWEAESNIETYTNILLSYYDRGYKIGAAEPEENLYGNDLFKLAEQWRHKALARKINNNIIKLSGL